MLLVGKGSTTVTSLGTFQEGDNNHNSQVSHSPLLGAKNQRAQNCLDTGLGRVRRTSIVQLT